jgi:hypothetical protein
VVAIFATVFVAFVPVFTASASAASTRTPVLGMKGFGVPSASGWGSYEPAAFTNGGDPSGSVASIRWKNWGHRAATGTGKGYIFKPTGGYYPGSVRVALRAFGLGRCTARGPLAYEHLDVRYPSHPGGRLGKWTPWSPTLCVTTTTSTTPSQSAGAPPCRNGQISVAVGTGGAGLGHEDQVILFTNTGSSTCSLYGYPGVAGLDAEGNQVVQAQRTLNGYLGGVQSGATSLPTVSLGPGQVASATVEGTDVPVGSATSCVSYPALLVTPPNLTDSVRVTATLPGCSPIEVHPVVAGSSGSAP